MQLPSHLDTGGLSVPVKVIKCSERSELIMMDSTACLGKREFTSEKCEHVNLGKKIQKCKKHRLMLHLRNWYYTKCVSTLAVLELDKI